jgi:hypothetical protein
MMVFTNSFLHAQLLIDTHPAERTGQCSTGFTGAKLNRRLRGDWNDQPFEELAYTTRIAGLKRLVQLIL